MSLSLKTSELLKLRLEHNLVEKHITQLKNALEQKDFDNFAQIVMKESNQLHAICLDTYPPIHYMNSYSHAVIELITSLNAEAG
jgi:diphosphomevalonate decarboxylase